MSSPAGKVTVLENVLSQCQLKMSSRQAMANSLTDGDTETFWESGDDDRNTAKHLEITCGDTVKPHVVCVHIDHTRDAGVSHVVEEHGVCVPRISTNQVRPPMLADDRSRREFILC